MISAFSSRRTARAGILVALVALIVAVAAAPAFGATIDYPNFSSVAGLTLNGSAAQSGSVLRLTPATTSQAGSAFSATTIDPTQPVHTTFALKAHDGTAQEARMTPILVSCAWNRAAGIRSRPRP